jgi:bifunctional polynucleotide phosphatase/kinase
MIIEKIIDILSTIDKEILIHCAEEIILKNKKIEKPSIVKLTTNQTTNQTSNKMDRPIIDVKSIHEPKNGAFIIKAELDNKPIKGASLIAGFDLDHTLIKPKSGNKFPKDYNDWIILENVKKKLNDLYEKGYKIVVFTNQAGSSFDPVEFAKKVKAIAALLEVPLQVFGCTDYGYCRKPSVGMWWLLTRNNDSIEIDMSRSFYVGDAAGRKGDFSDTDLKFALNLGLKFYCDIKMEENSFPNPVHPLEIANYANKYLDQEIAEPIDSQEMIILVGPPASGKSSFSKKFPDYVVACQDDLKTKPKVISMVKKALKEGQSVIVDRKNEYVTDRAEFIDIANEYEVPVRIIWFDMPRDLSEHLSTYREIMTGKHIPAIVFNKYFSKEKGLQIPTIEEGAEVIKLYFKKDAKEVENLTVFTSYLV